LPKVAVIIGSKSDQETMQITIDLLSELGIEAELKVASAHRDPEAVAEYVKKSVENGVEIFIAAAGGAAALPGVVASHTTLPVIGVPLTSSEMKGIDSLYSIVQMPPGMPVATVALGGWGARNSAVLAAQILGLKYDKIAEANKAYRQRLRER